MGVERRGRRGGAGGAFASGLHLPVHLVNWASVPRSGCVQIDQLQRFCTQTWHFRARLLSTCLWGVSLETWGAPGTRVFSFFLSFFFFLPEKQVRGLQVEALLRGDTGYAGGPGGRAGWAFTYELCGASSKPPPPPFLRTEPQQRSHRATVRLPTRFCRVFPNGPSAPPGPRTAPRRGR